MESSGRQVHNQSSKTHTGGSLLLTFSPQREALKKKKVSKEEVSLAVHFCFTLAQWRLLLWMGWTNGVLRCCPVQSIKTERNTWKGWNVTMCNLLHGDKGLTQTSICAMICRYGSEQCFAVLSHRFFHGKICCVPLNQNKRHLLLGKLEGPKQTNKQTHPTLTWV